MSRRLLPLLAAALILAAAVLTYHDTLRAPFVFDDLPSIVDNPNIKRLWPLSVPLTTAPQLPLAARPIVSLTFAINYAMTGLDPLSYHATNLLVHATTAFLLFLLARRTLRHPKISAPLHLPKPAPDYLALASALLFTLHPLNNECVNYTMQRTESLMALFALLTLYCFTNAVRPAPAPANVGSALADAPSSSSFILHPSSFTWLVLATLSAALAMGCKEVAAVIPLLTLVYARLFLSNSWRNLIKSHKIPLALIFSTYAVLAFLLRHNPRSATSDFSFALLTPWNYLKTEAGVLVFYLRMTLWPHPLVIDYFDWPLATRLTSVLPQALLVVALLLGTVYAIYKNHPLAIVGAFFFFTLAPTSSFIPLYGEYAAERRMYLPLTAILPALTLAAYLLLRRFVGPAQSRTLGLLLLTLAALACYFTNKDRNQDYASDFALWSATVDRRPDNARAINNLAAVYAIHGDIPHALEYYARAIKLEPNRHTSRRNYGVALANAGRYDAALEQFRASIALQDDPVTRAHLARVLLDLGQTAAGLREFARSTQGDPHNPFLHNEYAYALLEVHLPADALAQARLALDIDPTLIDAHVNAATAEQQLHHPTQALAHLRTALAQDPDNPPALAQLAFLLATTPDPTVRNPAEALTLAHRALNLPKSDPLPAKDALAAAQAAIGDYTSAITTAQQALDLATARHSPLRADIQSRLTQYQSRHPYTHQ